MPASPRRSIAVAKTANDQAWRGRTLLAGALMLAALLAMGLINLDWSAGPAMALGQAAGMTAPPLLLALAVWLLVARRGRKD